MSLFATAADLLRAGEQGHVLDGVLVGIDPGDGEVVIWAEVPGRAAHQCEVNEMRFKTSAALLKASEIIHEWYTTTYEGIIKTYEWVTLLNSSGEELGAIRFDESNCEYKLGDLVYVTFSIDGDLLRVKPIK